MQTNVNFEEYIARMETMTDKVTVLDYIPEGARVLDYGCGSGPSAHYFNPELYVGYDIATEMVERAKQENPGYSFVQDLSEVTEDFDGVIFSSLLHEVYSYNNFSYLEVIKTLKETRRILRPGGSIVIRDGIAPAGPNHPWRLQLTNPQDAAAFLKHLQETSPQTFEVEVEGDFLVGTKLAIIHFLNVYTWGWASVEREKYERVNFATLAQWQSMLASAHYQPLEMNIISQPDYFSNLERLVDLQGKRWETKLFLVATPES